jgi:hypothetical protein
MEFQRIRFALSRARHAAIGAAIGGAIGGLFSRNGASSGAAIGGLAGATFGELRANAGTGIDRFKQRGQETVKQIVPNSED